MSGRRWEWAPIEGWLSRQPGYGDPTLPGYAHLQVGLCDSSKLCMVRKRGWLSDIQAEHVAFHIGYDPSGFWPSWYDEPLWDELDARRRRNALQRARRTYERLCAMTADELSTWLGLSPAEAQPVEEAA